MFDIIEKYLDKYSSTMDYTTLYDKAVKKFGDDITNIHIINFIMYDKYDFFIYGQDNITLANSRIRQNDFRKTIIMRDKKCIITDSHDSLCEACHIIPYKDSKNYYNSNGILLDRVCHKMFDEYKLSFNGDRVVLRDDIINSPGYEKYQYNNKKVKIPQECITNIKKHYLEFCRRNNKPI